MRDGRRAFEGSGWDDGSHGWELGSDMSERSVWSRRRALQRWDAWKVDVRSVWSQRRGGPELEAWKKESPSALDVLDGLLVRTVTERRRRTPLG